MKVRFLGAVGIVTGSCSWLQDTDRNWNFLIDCGMQQEARHTPHWSEGAWPFDPKAIQFVGLTHAHLDHCGLLPLLVAKGFKGPVYCTAETAEMAKIILEDAARLPNAPYNADHVARIRWSPFDDQGKALGDVRPVATDLFLRAYRSGHVVGAVSLAVMWGAPGPDQRSIVFSGDIGPGHENQEYSPLIRFPWSPRAANFAVMESTYGDRVRPASDKDPERRRAGLKQALDRIIDTGGTMLVPAFALGRSQDLLYDLHCIVADDPVTYQALKVVLDAGLAKRLQQIVAKGLRKSDTTRKSGKTRPMWLGKQVFRDLGLDDTDPADIDTALEIVGRTLLTSADQTLPPITRGNLRARQWRPLTTNIKAMALDRTTAPPGPTVVVCGSADGSSGAAARWLPTLLGDDRHLIASCGYTAPGSLLSAVMLHARQDPLERRRNTGSLTWGERHFPIREIAAKAIALGGYSAHADQSELVDWYFPEYQGERVPLAPVVFLQHGEDKARRALKGVMDQRAAALGHELQIVMPTPSKQAQWHDLEATVAAASCC